MFGEDRAVPFWPSIWAVICTKKTIIFWFFIINIFFGAMGILAPLLPYLLPLDPEQSASKLAEVLHSSGGYTYAIAYLAATSGYLVTEFIENDDSLFKHQKLVVAGLGVIVGVICGVLTAHEFSTPHSSLVIGTQEKTQLCLTIASVLIGFILAILQWAGTVSLNATIDKKQAQIEDSSKRTMAAAKLQQQGEVTIRTIKGRTVKV